ncbi:YrhB domain-containing protein [Streptomyces fulvoviolaceus]|uniref:YrhB domain-containing protein n=1 Tax=Streptomyces fulvoviolaceus TaxID=285535 RepID=UPI0030B7FF43
MIEREAAVRIAEEELNREYQKWSAAGVDSIRTAVVHVEEHELVWIIYWQSEEFMRTRNPSAMLIGNGPYLVDRIDGGGCIRSESYPRRAGSGRPTTAFASGAWPSVPR